MIDPRAAQPVIAAEVRDEHQREEAIVQVGHVAEVLPLSVGHLAELKADNGDKDDYRDRAVDHDPVPSLVGALLVVNEERVGDEQGVDDDEENEVDPKGPPVYTRPLLVDESLNEIRLEHLHILCLGKGLDKLWNIFNLLLFTLTHEKTVYCIPYWSVPVFFFSRCVLGSKYILNNSLTIC